MTRLLSITRYLLPIGLGLAAAGVAFASGGTTVEGGLACVCGALVGLVGHLLLGSFASLLGKADVPSTAGRARLAELEQDKRLVLRLIKEIEFDVTLGRLDQAEAEHLIAPLRQRALRLLRDLDEAQVQTRTSIEDEIEREVARRLTFAETALAEEGRR